MDMISHSTNDLVWQHGGKLDSKPSLLWKRRQYCWEITQLLREIECILSMWFLSSKHSCLVLSLAANTLLLLKTPITQLSAGIDLTNSEYVSHSWNFPPWLRSEPLRFLDGVGFDGRSYGCDEEGKNLTRSKRSLWTLLFYVLTCSVCSQLSVTGMLSHTQPRKTES